MKHTNKDFLLRALIIIGLSIFFFGTVLVFTLMSGNEEFVRFLILICATILVAIILRYQYSTKINKYINSCIRAIESLEDITLENVTIVSGNPIFEDFNEKLQEVWSTLKERENIRQRVLNIVNSAVSNMEMESLLKNLMPKLIDVTSSNCGVFYLANLLTNKLEIKHSLGFSRNIYSEFDLTIGEGLVGSAATNKEIKIITSLSDDTIYTMRTFLGKIKPKCIMVVPIVNQDQLLGVFAFASINNYSDEQLEIVKLIKYYVGAAVGNALTFEKTKRLTNELKFQNRLIQNLNDNLEKKVQSRTNFLNEIINSIKGYAVYAVDLDGTILVWNKGAELLLGYSSKEVLGKNLDYIYSVEDIENGVLRKKIDKARVDGDYVERSIRVRKDGTECYTETFIFSRYDQDGELIGFTSIIRDLTTLKNLELSLNKEEAKESLLTLKSNKVSIITDKHGVIISINNKGEQILNDNYPLEKCIYDFFENKNAVRNYVNNFTKDDSIKDAVFNLKSGTEVNLSVSMLTNSENMFSYIFYLYEN